MRLLWLRCIALLLSLALVAGNAHAELHPGNPPPDQACPPSAGHSHGDDSHHRHDKSSRSGCCCDCLACVSALNLLPGLNSVRPAFYGTTVRFGDESRFLPGRSLPPELDPPRPGTLS